MQEFQTILKDKVELESKNIDSKTFILLLYKNYLKVEEFQGECEEIAKKKVLKAFTKVK